MAQLIVRNLDERTVQRLRLRAARHGRSVEAEHREILRQVLAMDAGPSLKSWLQAMPAGGEDADFEAPRDLPRDVEL